MTNVAMKYFGTTLTDRADGKKAAEAILRKYILPIQLDFSGVYAMGSSFGDEVVLKIAKEQGNVVRILNANNVIKHSLHRVIENKKVALTFDP